MASYKESPNILALSAGDCDLTLATLLTTIGVKRQARFIELDLSRALRLTSEGLVRLLKPDALISVQVLELAHLDVTDELFKQISGFKSLRELRLKRHIN